ncbi:anhydro-N-acetylmuramic acid kinase [Fontibacillus panacisegetis]|uniref:Anhydro-N-acetylmuramic acid kinase n=1 Tax=Fontibacillus panacisegetis TaxID=670482 RepID=A0A1G7NMQ3_9BACL|nr:anhydro-N-acetylmuramic acid kinase [Fontibacillus panacisegetis]SDF74569.1 anhydro-N-acetylmuramic acid kinase [Fontibacillus panacisegetis]
MDKQSKVDAAYLVGLMSGTSVDGIDAAVVKLSPPAEREQGVEVELLAFENTPFEVQVRNSIFELFDPANATIDKVGAMNMWLGELYAQATLSIIGKSGLSPSQIFAVGSHGQTIYHAPEENVMGDYNLHCTVQIGDGAVIANRTGIPCVSDFRVADMAMGGQGAPLVPFTEYLLFSNPETTLLMQNIGGIGNVTVLPANASPEGVFAFDTGPGNMIIDGLVSQLYAPMTMDVGGEISASGQVIDELLKWMQQDEYYKMPLPKSTGRERFGGQYVAQIMELTRANNWTAEDVVATATYLTAWSIVDSYERYIAPKHQAQQLLIGGGGSYNKTLLRDLQQLFTPHKVQVLTQEDIGGNSDAKEAIAFAMLAYYTMKRLPNNIPLVTGASQPVIMGKVSYPYLGR